MTKSMILAVFVALAAAGCASRPVHDECAFLDAAAPAAVQGAIVGAVTGRVAHDRNAGLAAGAATGVWAYNSERERCARAVEERRRAADRAYREWSYNNRCMTRTVDEFGRRVVDRRECTHIDYGQTYMPKY